MNLRSEQTRLIRLEEQSKKAFAYFISLLPEYGTSIEEIFESIDWGRVLQELDECQCESRIREPVASIASRLPFDLRAAVLHKHELDEMISGLRRDLIGALHKKGQSAEQIAERLHHTVAFVESFLHGEKDRPDHST